MLAFEDDGNAYWYPGNYSEYEEDRVNRLGENAGQPRRSRYKKLEA